MPISGANFTPLDHFFLRNRSSNGIKGSRQSYASHEANLCSWVEQSGHCIQECVSTFSYLLARGGLGNSKLYRPHVCRTCLFGTSKKFLLIPSITLSLSFLFNQLFDSCFYWGQRTSRRTYRKAGEVRKVTRIFSRRYFLLPPVRTHTTLH